MHFMLAWKWRNASCSCAMSMNVHPEVFEVSWRTCLAHRTSSEGRLQGTRWYTHMQAPCEIDNGRSAEASDTIQAQQGHWFTPVHFDAELSLVPVLQAQVAPHRWFAKDLEVAIEGRDVGIVWSIMSDKACKEDNPLWAPQSFHSENTLKWPLLDQFGGSVREVYLQL